MPVATRQDLLNATAQAERAARISGYNRLANTSRQGQNAMVQQMMAAERSAQAQDAQLGYQREELAQKGALGNRSLDVQRQLGQGRLDVQREGIASGERVGMARNTTAQRGQDITRDVEGQRIGMQRELGTRQMDIAEMRALDDTRLREMGMSNDQIARLRKMDIAEQSGRRQLIQSLLPTMTPAGQEAFVRSEYGSAMPAIGSNETLFKPPMTMGKQSMMAMLADRMKQAVSDAEAQGYAEQISALEQGQPLPQLTGEAAQGQALSGQLRAAMRAEQLGPAMGMVGEPLGGTSQDLGAMLYRRWEAGVETDWSQPDTEMQAWIEDAARRAAASATTPQEAISAVTRQASLGFLQRTPGFSDTVMLDAAASGKLGEMARDAWRSPAGKVAKDAMEFGALIANQAAPIVRAQFGKARVMQRLAPKQAAPRSQ